MLATSIGGDETVQSPTSHPHQGRPSTFDRNRVFPLSHAALATPCLPDLSLVVHPIQTGRSTPHAPQQADASTDQNMHITDSGAVSDAHKGVQSNHLPGILLVLFEHLELGLLLAELRLAGLEVLIGLPHGAGGVPTYSSRTIQIVCATSTTLHQICINVCSEGLQVLPDSLSHTSSTSANKL